jgi:hypothetical protein
MVLSNWVTIWQTYCTLLVQHHGVVNSEILYLAFIAFRNQALQVLSTRTMNHVNGSVEGFLSFIQSLDFEKICANANVSPKG